MRVMRYGLLFCVDGLTNSEHHAYPPLPDKKSALYSEGKFGSGAILSTA